MVMQVKPGVKPISAICRDADKLVNVRLVERYDLVQVNPALNDTWGMCVVCVDEVRSFGIIGWVRIPVSEGLAWVRLNWAEIKFVGAAGWGPDERDADAIEAIAELRTDEARDATTMEAIAGQLNDGIEQ